MGVDIDICRFCRQEGDKQNPLYHPCLCNGSIRYIHSTCLKEWLDLSRKNYCELCLQKFRYLKVYTENSTISNSSQFTKIMITIRAMFQSLFAAFLILMLFYSWFMLLPWIIGMCGQSMLIDEYKSVVSFIMNVSLYSIKIKTLIYMISIDIIHGYVYCGCAALVIFISLCVLNILINNDEPKWLLDIVQQSTSRFTIAVKQILDNDYENIVADNNSTLIISEEVFAEALQYALEPLYYLIDNNQFTYHITPNILFINSTIEHDIKIVQTLQTIIFQRTRCVRVWQAFIIHKILNIDEILIPEIPTLFHITDSVAIRVISTRISARNLAALHINTNRDTPNNNVEDTTESLNDNHSSTFESDDISDDEELANISVTGLDFGSHILEAINEFSVIEFLGVDNPTLYMMNTLKIFVISMLMLVILIIIPNATMRFVGDIFYYQIVYNKFQFYDGTPSLLIDNGAIDSLILSTLFYGLVLIILYHFQIILRGLNNYLYAFIASMAYLTIKVMYSICFHIFTVPIIYGAIITNLIHYFIDGTYPTVTSKYFQKSLLIVEWWLLGLLFLLSFVSFIIRMKKAFRTGLHIIYKPQKDVSPNTLNEIVQANLFDTLTATIKLFFINILLIIVYIFAPIYCMNMLINNHRFLSFLSSTSTKLSFHKNIIKHENYFISYEQFVVEFIYAFFMATNVIHAIETSTIIIYQIHKLLTQLSSFFDLYSFIYGSSIFMEGYKYMTINGLKEYNDKNKSYFRAKNFTPYIVPNRMRLKVTLLVISFIGITFCIITFGLTIIVLLGKVLIVGVFGYNNITSTYIYFSAGNTFFFALYYFYINFDKFLINLPSKSSYRKLILFYIKEKLQQHMIVYTITILLFPYIIGEFVQYWILICLKHNIGGDIITSTTQSLIIGTTVTNIFRSMLCIIPEEFVQWIPVNIRINLINIISSQDYAYKFCLPLIKNLSTHVVTPYCFLNLVLYTLDAGENMIRSLQFIFCMAPSIAIIFIVMMACLKNIINWGYQLHLAENYFVEKILLNRARDYSTDNTNYYDPSQHPNILYPRIRRRGLTNTNQMVFIADDDDDRRPPNLR